MFLRVYGVCIWIIFCICGMSVCIVCFWCAWGVCGLTVGGAACLCAVLYVSGMCDICMVHEGCGVPCFPLQPVG